MASKKPHFTMGIFFTIGGIISCIVALTVSTAFKDKDYDAILQNGVESQAEIVNVKSQENVEIKGENPVVITYTYTDNGKLVTDGFKTLDLYKANGMVEKGTVNIKVYNGESAIIGLKPFEFPFFIFMFAPAIFLIGGIIMLLVTLLPALKKYKLYKTGIVKGAEVYGIMPVAGLPITNIGRKVSVDYTYTGRNGNEIYGNSVSDDFTLLARVKPGDAIKIFVSETDEIISTLVPEDLARKNNWKI